MGSPGANDCQQMAEQQSRRREGILLLTTALAVALFALLEIRLPQFSSGQSVGGNVFFFLLINLNILLLVLLVFLVGRNLVKVLFERRRRLLGSHLRTRLVLAFVAVSLFPALLLLMVAVWFMTNSIENWFNVQVERSLQSSLEMAQAYYNEAAGNAVLHARRLARQIAAEGFMEGNRREALVAFIDGQRREYNLGTIAVFSATGELVATVPSDVSPSLKEGADGQFVESLLRGELVSKVRAANEADIVRGGAPVQKGEEGDILGALVVDDYVPHSVVKPTSQIAQSFQEYRQLKILKQPIKNNYMLTMILVTLVVVFSAIWVGYYLARGITVPLQRLAEGTRAVAQGHWDYRIEREGEDEIGTVVSSFNQMTADLKKIHGELEERRRYMEIILTNITAGVVSINPEGFVTMINKAAEQLLGLAGQDFVGRKYDELFARRELAEVGALVNDLLGRDSAPAGEEDHNGAERQLTIPRGERVLSLLVSAAPLREAGASLGVVCFFEDVSHILKVERMEAWREVARRIAHEIKNPLTPIQLAAQRLHKRFAHRLAGERGVFEECTRTIVQQVDELKKLVNEFSAFARLPAADPTPQNLNAVVEETLVLFKEGHRNIDFIFHAKQDLPPLQLDREGIKRVLINMLDNAVAACIGMTGEDGGKGRIEILTRYYRSHEIVRLEIADNGCGMTPEVKARLFEPYFSTKKEGTGLGLAIVSAIVADHNAFIRVRDNPPRGSRFIIEFPVRGAGHFLAHAGS